MANITLVVDKESLQRAVLGTARTETQSLRNRFGEWGHVLLRHSWCNAVDVQLDTGVVLNNVPVASREWVILGADSEKDYTSGERDLPPEKARVFVFLPTYEEAFVAPFSGFGLDDTKKNAPFFELKKDATRERITPDKWRIEHDRKTGSIRAESPNREACVEIREDTDNNGTFTLAVHGATIRITPGGVVTIEGDVTVGSRLTVDGTAAPGESGGFCAIPNCMFTGQPHVGNVIAS